MNSDQRESTVIKNNMSVSEVGIDIRQIRPRGLCIDVPAGWTAADIGFSVSETADGATKKALYKDGERVKITSVVEGLNIAPAEVWAVGTYPFLFLESLDSSTGNAKNQAGGDKTLVVAMLY